MDCNFIKANCHRCLYAVLAGQDAKGEYRVQRCVYRFAHADKNRAALKGGDDLGKLQSCPKTTEAKAA